MKLSKIVFKNERIFKLMQFLFYRNNIEIIYIAH